MTADYKKINNGSNWDLLVFILWPAVQTHATESALAISESKPLINFTQLNSDYGHSINRRKFFV